MMPNVTESSILVPIKSASGSLLFYSSEIPPFSNLIRSVVTNKLGVSTKWLPSPPVDASSRAQSFCGADVPSSGATQLCSSQAWWVEHIYALAHSTSIHTKHNCLLGVATECMWLLCAQLRCYGGTPPTADHSHLHPWCNPLNPSSAPTPSPCLLRTAAAAVAAAVGVRVSCAAGAMDKITFGAAGLPGYETGPKNGPAIIVLQEWWGEQALVPENFLEQPQLHAWPAPTRDAVTLQKHSWLLQPSHTHLDCIAPQTVATRFHFLPRHGHCIATCPTCYTKRHPDQSFQC